MKKTLFSIAIIATALVAASCQKDNSAFVEEQSSFFGNTTTTKTVIDVNPSGYWQWNWNYGKVYWVEGDKIKVNNKEYTALTGGETSTEFTAKGAAPAGPYYAFYPAKLVENNSKTNLPWDLKYDAAASYLPMFAYSETTTLDFDNICGVFKVYVKNNTESNVTLKEVLFTSAANRISGRFTIDQEGNVTMVEEGPGKDAKKVKVKDIKIALAPAETSEGVLVPIPPKVFAANDLTVTIKYKVESVETKGAADFEVSYIETKETTVEKNKIYPFTLDLVKADRPE